MSKKILFTASTMSHIENFHLPYLEEFRRMGWEVEAVALPVSKSFISIKNIRAIFSTRKLLMAGHYDVISSHSTLAGIVTRLAVMLSGKGRKNMKVFHTAHGYLFHDDRGLKKWVYLLPEMFCGKVTDVLMVMNHEDLDIAKKYKLCGKGSKIYYINGMGIDLSRFQTALGVPLQCTKDQKASFGIAEDDFVFVYAAEFSKRKNHELLLRGFARAIQKLNSQEMNIEYANKEAQSEIPSRGLAENANHSVGRLKLVLAGDGVLFDEMKRLANELGIADQVIFLGYTRNMNELYPCCDVAVSTSRIEGLPFNIMEAMACGLPVIASNIKGHKELIEHEMNGLLFESGSLDQLSDYLIKIYSDHTCKGTFSDVSLIKVGDFSIDIVKPIIMEIYYNID